MTEVVGDGQKWSGVVGNGQRQSEMVENIWKWSETVENFALCKLYIYSSHLPNGFPRNLAP